MRELGNLSEDYTAAYDRYGKATDEVIEAEAAILKSDIAQSAAGAILKEYIDLYLQYGGDVGQMDEITYARYTQCKIETVNALMEAYGFSSDEAWFRVHYIRINTTGVCGIDRDALQQAATKSTEDIKTLDKQNHAIIHDYRTVSGALCLLKHPGCEIIPEGYFLLEYVLNTMASSHAQANRKVADYVELYANRFNTAYHASDRTDPTKQKLMQMRYGKIQQLLAWLFGQNLAEDESAQLISLELRAGLSPELQEHVLEILANG